MGKRLMGKGLTLILAVSLAALLLTVCFSVVNASQGSPPQQEAVIPPRGMWAGAFYLTADGEAVKRGEAVKASVEAVGWSHGWMHGSVEYALVEVGGRTYWFEAGKAFLGKKALLIVATGPSIRPLEKEAEEGAVVKEGAEERKITVGPSKLFLIAYLTGGEGEERPVKCVGLLLVRGARFDVWRLKLTGTLLLLQEAWEKPEPIVTPLPRD